MVFVRAGTNSLNITNFALQPIELRRQVNQVLSFIVFVLRNKSLIFAQVYLNVKIDLHLS